MPAAHGAVYQGRRGIARDCRCFQLLSGEESGLLRRRRNPRNQRRGDRFSGAHASQLRPAREISPRATCLQPPARHGPGRGVAREASASRCRKRGARRAAAQYDQLLANVPGVTRPFAAPDRTHVYHLYVIEHDRRNELSAFLKTHGISCGLHYPIPVHLQECYAGLKVPVGSLPVTEGVAKRIVSLPIFPTITEAQIQHVVQSIGAFVKG